MKTIYIFKGDDIMKKNCIRRFVRYMRRTYKNKIIASLLLSIGWISTLIDNDGTFLLMVAMFAIPLFFAKRNWIYY